MGRRLETLFVFVIVAIGAVRICLNLWDIAATTSEADLWAMARFYFEMAAGLALGSVLLVAMWFGASVADAERPVSL